MHAILTGAGPRDRLEWALVLCGIWLHLGYIAVASAAIGLLKVGLAEASVVPPLAQVFFGAVLAACCWRRARIVLEQAEDAERTATSSSSRAAAKA